MKRRKTTRSNLISEKSHTRALKGEKQKAPGLREGLPNDHQIQVGQTKNLLKDQLKEDAASEDAGSSPGAPGTHR